MFWELNTVDARGNAIDETLGNSIAKVFSSFDPLTGLIEHRTAGTSSPYTNRQNLAFQWDNNGNLTDRIDGNQSNLTEHFYYDVLDRLTSSTRNGTMNLYVQYIPNGNVYSRSDYGGAAAFSYDNKPHAVTSVSGNCGSCCSWTDTFQYDANGNMTVRGFDGVNSSTSWYSYNLPNTIALGSSWSQSYYTPNRALRKQVANYGGTTETTIYVGGILEKTTRGSVTEYRHYIPAGPSSTVIYTRRSDNSNSTYYTTSDHLGSSTVTMDSSGATLVNTSFGAFGKRRGAAWNDVPLSGDWDQITATSRHGFTGHEQLDSVAAIHMNGRVYDPRLGRFMSADPVYVGDLANPQSLNPYSYVSNRPLSATDPSGFTEWSGQAGYFSAGVVMDSAAAELELAISNYTSNLNLWINGCRSSCADFPPPERLIEVARDFIAASVSQANFITGLLLGDEQAQLDWQNQVDEWERAQQVERIERKKWAALVAGDMETFNDLMQEPTFGEFLKMIWNFPNTTIGMLVGGITSIFGGTAVSTSNALEFRNNGVFHLFGGGAMTFGYVIIYGSSRYDRAGDDNMFYRHETQHIPQGEILGPLYLPAHAILGAGALIFNGRWHGPFNVLEAGPQQHPPQPWP